MNLTDKMKAAIRKSAEASQAEAREKHADNPNTLRSIGEIEEMLYDLEVLAYETGYHNPMLAVAFEEALEAVQSQINASVPITPETVLTVKNPYAA